jgi:hypothetical protein
VLFKDLLRSPLPELEGCVSRCLPLLRYFCATGLDDVNREVGELKVGGNWRGSGHGGWCGWCGWCGWWVWMARLCGCGWLGCLGVVAGCESGWVMGMVCAVVVLCGWVAW